MSEIRGNNKNVKKKRKKKKKSIGFKILMGFLAILVALTALGGGYIYGLFKKLDTVKLDDKNLGISSKEEFSKYDNFKDIKNIALFGVDTEDGGVGRSDSIMVATLDPIHKKLKLTSLMRDSYVNIEGYGNDKLNHAYAFGGPQLSIKTINENFGFNIEDFISVNFSSLPVIIDILGGIELEITDEEVGLINNYVSSLNSSSYVTSSGYQYLNGDQALAYSRVRYTEGGDYKRTERQRLVLEAVFEKLLSTPASSYSSILNNVLPYVQTNLSPTEILSLGTKVVGIGSTSLQQERFPRDGFAEGTMINGIYYLQYDKTTTIEQVRNYIFDDK